MKKLLAMSVLLVVTLTGCLHPGWFGVDTTPRVYVVTATPEGGPSQVVVQSTAVIVPAGPASQGGCQATWPAILGGPSYRAYENDPSQGVYTFQQGVVFSAPILIVMDKLAGGGNDFTSKRIVYGTFSSKLNGAHVIALQSSIGDASCEADNEM